MNGWRRLLAASLTLVVLEAGAIAEPVPPHADSASVTRGQVIADGKPIRYTATAAQYPLYDNDTGELMATMFFVAYVADRAPGSAPRPLTFLWNGGPGSSASQLHMVGFGPKRLRTPERYPQWTSQLQTPIVDNPHTWLASSDLVFVDPPGTGFSRATSKQNRDILYTTRGDAEAVAELIRIYLTRNHRWGAPLYIAGESYGTNRAMAVADALETRRTHLSGVLLISGNFDLGQKVPKSLESALNLTHETVTAYYHGMLPADLQARSREEAVNEAADWARRVYAPALERGEALPPAERAAVVAGLQRYTGVDPKYIDEAALAVKEFSDNLLRGKNLEMGRYDSRMTRTYRGDTVSWMPWDDPSLRPMVDLMQGTSVVFNGYMRDTLKFESDLLYRGPWGGAFHPEPLQREPGGFPSDWMTRMFVIGEYDPGAGEPPLRVAMERNPQLRVASLIGMYDTFISCAARAAQVASIDPQFKGRVIERCYVGGHMWYSDLDTRAQAQRDFAQFVHAP